MKAFGASLEERKNLSGTIIRLSKMERKMCFRLLPYEYNGLICFPASQYHFKFPDKDKSGASIFNHKCVGYPDYVERRKKEYQKEGDDQALALMANDKMLDQSTEYLYLILLLDQQGKIRSDMPFEDCIKLLSVNPTVSGKLINTVVDYAEQGLNLLDLKMGRGITVTKDTKGQYPKYEVMVQPLALALHQQIWEEDLPDIREEVKRQLVSERYVNALVDKLITGEDYSADLKDLPYKPERAVKEKVEETSPPPRKRYVEEEQPTAPPARTTRSKADTTLDDLKKAVDDDDEYDV